MRIKNHYILLLAAVITLSFAPVSNKKLVENYIDSYKDIAISEMNRTGIPASIKLAQGILESDLGRSLLAVKANNHFGIKCGSQWTGDTYFKVDDDTDEDGFLIESCFRSYIHAEESYIAHSDFLGDPKKSSRYGFLFDFGSTDYVSWANGLRFSGYATDPAYPEKLINIIEKYKLYEFDSETDFPSTGHYVDNTTKNLETETLDEPQRSNQTTVSANSSTRDNKTSRKTTRSSRKSFNESSKTRKSQSAVNFINGLKMVYAQKNESVIALARRVGVSADRLMEYNEGLESRDYFFPTDEIVYLEKKKKNIEGESQFHTVMDGETMYSISQLYGIRLESLLAKNNLPENAQPLVGEEISLVKHITKKQSPRYRPIKPVDDYVDLGDLR